MIKKSFLLFKDSLSVLEDLNDDQRGKLFYAIYCFQINKTIKLDPITKIAFSQFKTQFQRDTLKYEAKCKINQNNIRKRWDTKNTKNTNGINGINKNTNHTYKDKDKDKDKDNKTIKNNKKDLKLQTQEKLKKYSNINLESFWEWYGFKKFKTIAGVTKSLNLLEAQPSDTQKNMIDTAIRSEWSGIHQPKTNKNTNKVDNSDVCDEYLK